jgi:hypothetical protein
VRAARTACLLFLLVLFQAGGLAAADEAVIAVRLRNAGPDAALRIDGRDLRPGPGGECELRVPLTGPAYVPAGPPLPASVYLTPGDSLHVDVDARDPSAAPVFGGSAVPANRYLASVLAEEKTMGEQLSGLERKAFLREAERKEDAHLDRLDEFLKRNDPGPLFERVEQARITYWWAGVRLRSDELAPRFITAAQAASTRWRGTQASGEPPARGVTDGDVESWIDRLDWDDPALLDLTEYRDFLLAVVERAGDALLVRTREAGGSPRTPAWAHFTAAHRLFPDLAMREPLLCDLLVRMAVQGTEGAPGLRETFRRECTRGDLMEKVDRAFERAGEK